MTNVRVHNFAVSIDGFATGEGQAVDAPVGHAGKRLHTWMFVTELIGEHPGGGVDATIARANDDGIVAEIMGRGTFRPESGPVTAVDIHEALGLATDTAGALHDRYDIETVASPTGPTHLTLPRR